jgi:hypothetical protein
MFCDKALIEQYSRIIGNIYITFKYVRVREKIGFKDRNGKELRNGHLVKTKDRFKNIWYGHIKPVDIKNVIQHPFLKDGHWSRTLYAFKSYNLETWINDYRYASELEII